MSFFLIAILVYLAYLFIFRLVIPIYITTRKVKKGFREMQERMQQQTGANPQYNPEPNATKSGQKPPKTDYIEFEEV